MRLWLANGISFSRLVLLLPWTLLEGRGRAALPLVCLVIATDLLDGPVARRLGAAGERGARIDSYCDLVFCLVATLVLGVGLPLYFLVSAAMVLAFAVWLALQGRRGRVVYTRLGKYSGALCYALVGFASARGWIDSRGGAVFDRLEALLAAFVVLYLLASSLENLGLFAVRNGGAARGGKETRTPSQ